jgi:hypothetical protein
MKSITGHIFYPANLQVNVFDGIIISVMVAVLGMAVPESYMRGVSYRPVQYEGKSSRSSVPLDKEAVPLVSVSTFLFPFTLFLFP